MTLHRLLPIALALASTLAAATSAARPRAADLVIENARIWTPDRDGFAPFAAVHDGRFVHVGDPVPQLAGPDTVRIDAAGRIVVPGLIDAHVHMLGGGRHLSELNLRDAADRDDFVRRIADWTKSLEPGEWIRGGRWSTESWADPAPPSRTWVDAVTGDHPLYLPRMDGHSALVNSAALRLAGITRDTPPDPEGGVIDRDPRTGEPTGILRESAMGLVAVHAPAPALEDQLDALRRAMREANRHGITAVCDIPGIEDLPVYAALSAEDVTVRLFLYPTALDWPAAVETVLTFKPRPLWVQINGLKTYLDGSLGSRTAFMQHPFHGNEPGREAWRGLLREGVTGGGLERNLAAARDAGLQPIAHAIGDAANHLLLETLVHVYGDALPRARARSEHAQHLLPHDIAAFGRHGVIASMQPYHKADDGRYAESYLGAERVRSSYAYRSLLNAGAVVAFGSDWPVVTIDPFLGIEAAVTGRTLDGRPWQTQESITVGAALRAYTSAAAHAALADDAIGRIAPGCRADFVVLDGDPFAPDVAWERVRPARVYVDGRLVHDADRN